MSIPCQGKDERLLMLAHGQLGFFERIGILRHVKSCPSCRSRLARYERLSSAIAVVMASPNGMRVLPSLAFKSASIRSAFLALVIISIMALFWTLKGPAAAAGDPSSTHPTLKRCGHASASPEAGATKACDGPIPARDLPE